MGQMPAPMLTTGKLASVSAKGAGVFVTGKVGGCETRLLIDTGAQVSIVPKQFWLNVTKGGSSLDGYQGKVAVANGGEMSILGRWQTVCQFESLAVIVEFLVADVTPQELLLGTDFLSKFGAVIDLGDNCCRLMGKKLPLFSEDASVQPKVVRVQKDIMLPPRTESILPGKVDGLFPQHYEGMLEPMSIMLPNCEVLVARVVCKVEEGVVPVRVINVSEDNCLLKQNMKIGTFYPDVEVSDSAPITGSNDTAPPFPLTVDCLVSQFGLKDRGFDSIQMQAVEELLSRNASVFSKGDTDLGRTHLALHKIDTGSAQPIKLPPRRVPLHLQQEVAEHIKQMQDNNIIRPSCSPWAAPVVLVRKKDGSLRFCVDYRKLNEVTRKDAYPLPRIDDALDSLTNACWFSTLDLASGYWQVEVDPQDRPKTAFITRQGLFEFNVLSFGLCNSPSTFQRLMDVVLADLQWTTCLVYLDDIIVFGRTFQEHLQRLDEVLCKLRYANLKVKPSKCTLFASQVQYLGHVISTEGVTADPSKVEAIRTWPVPKTQTEVRSFLGLASYYRRFIQGFAEIARPLHRLTEKGRRFCWGEECQEAFQQLKARLIVAPVLAYPDPKKPFILDTDASDVGIGAVLSQECDGLERVVAYASRALTKQERKYATTKKELLSMVTFTKHFKHYLLGREFLLRTDHNSLRWLHNFGGLEGQLARWVEQLANFQYKIIHRPGKQHANADALSRLPGALRKDVEEDGDEVPKRCSHVTTVRAVSEAERPGNPLEGRADIEDELVKAQQGDPVIQELIQLKSSELGGISHTDLNPALVKYLPVWDQLQVQNQRLVRVPPVNTDAAAAIQVVLPRSLIPEVLSMLHNTQTGGHLGIQKLQAKVKDRFYWPGWFGDVKQWCRECHDCASRKSGGKAPCAPLQMSIVSRPYERVAVDIMGPLPETLGKNRYILVIGDYFSKWTEAFPLPNQEAQSVARVLVEEWVCRYGVPRSLHSDQGRNFESLLFKELCRLLQINKSRTSPYHPQSDGLIERFNRTLLSMLSLFVDNNQTNWDKLLPYVMMAYRSSLHASTGFTPYKVLFGQEMVLPVDIMLGIDNGQKFQSVNDYVAGLAESLSTVVEAVKRHQNQASNQQKTCADFRANFHYYVVGELVWIHNKARKRGVCPKLQRRFKGPFKILERVSDVLYKVQPLEGGPENVVHFNRMKPYVACSVSEPVGDIGSPILQDQVLPQPRINKAYKFGWGGHQPAESEDAQMRERAAGSVMEERNQTPEPVMLDGGDEGSFRENSSLVVVDTRSSPTQQVAMGQDVAVKESASGNSSQVSRPARARRPPVWSEDYNLM